MPRRDGFVARLRDPAVLIHQAWRRLYILRHPDHPWLDPAAIRYLEGALDRSMIGLEWGSGRSTRWFASRLKHLTSVEHDSSWHERVRDALTRHGVSNVDQRLIPVPDADKHSADVYWSENPYVMVVSEFAEASLDVVLVDGLYRQNCVARALPKIRVGGLLIIDNVDFLPQLADWGVPTDWPLVHLAGRRFFDTAIWRRPV